MSRAGEGATVSTRGHLAGTFGWSAAGDADWAAILAVALGMAGPVLVAASAGQLPLGLAASFGSLLAGNARTGRSLGEQLRNLASVLTAAGAAVLAAVLIAGHAAWTDAATVVLASAAAVAGGYSRGVAVGTGRFIVFLMMTVSVADAASDRAGLLALMAAGALWTSVLALLFGGLARAVGWIAAPAPEIGVVATAGQRFRRWGRSLRQFAGWQFALRLGSCLVIAGVLRWWWPGHHFHWIALTVAILSQRQLETLPVRMLQRAIGAMLGVAAAGLLVGHLLAGWALASLIAVAFGCGAWLRPRNYLAYTASTTPLIILLVDAGRPVEMGVLVDRLLATMIGAGLVIGMNAMAAKTISNSK